MRSIRPRRALSLLASGLAALCAAPGFAHAQPTDTRTITDRYVELTCQRRYDELRDVYADDAVFFDPTGDVFAGRVADGPVHGGDEIVALQKSWGIADARFQDPTAYASNGASYAQPGVMIVEVHDGRVTRHWDFVDYSVGAS